MTPLENDPLGTSHRLGMPKVQGFDIRRFCFCSKAPPRLVPHRGAPVGSTFRQRLFEAEGPWHRCNEARIDRRGEQVKVLFLAKFLV